MEQVPVLRTPPGAPSQPYVLPCYTGELWTIPTSNSTMRLLVTGRETSNAFAVVGTGGTTDAPIGFHYHKEAHDVFLCLKGKLNVWADDQARSLSPGDFASVPPGTIHRYQIDSQHTEFLGLIVPGGWEEFFRFIGEPYTGSLFPTNDKRSPFEVLIPKLMAAAEKFDMIPVRNKQHFDPQPWNGSENLLPGVYKRGGYFLKDGEGEKWAADGKVLRPLATREETDGKFSIYEVQGSRLHDGSSEKKQFQFEISHHAIYVVDGVMKVFIGGDQAIATTGETTFIPAGKRWRFEAASTYARAYIFSNGGGIGEMLTRVGVKIQEPAFSLLENDFKFDAKEMESIGMELKSAMI